MLKIICKREGVDMANRNNKTNIKDERIEDSTLFGEFIASFDQWVTPDRQRNNARHLEEATDELAPKDVKKRSE
jgi:hypothetical protein